MDQQREIWEERYGRVGSKLKLNYEPWLELWEDRFARKGFSALDLGCGAGFDSEWLFRRGADVLGVDLSAEAVALAAKRVPSGAFKQVDLREGLDLARKMVDVVVSNLALHYFDREDTLRIFREIRSVQRDGGELYFRVNANHDANYGAIGNNESWDLVDVKGISKQFFTEAKIQEALAGLYKIESIELKTTDRFGKTKALYEVLAIAV